MCTNPYPCYSNSRYISILHPHRMKNSFKCGLCAECIDEKRREWSVRSQYEAERCLKEKGFVLFDTLTYRDESLRFYHDFTDFKVTDFDSLAFNPHDIRLFIELLRQRLKRSCYDVTSENFRWLLTSEFGSRPNRTHRPHYHILFFVNFKIKPEILSRYIAECWPHGITDGVRPYLSQCNDWRFGNYSHPDLKGYKSKYYVLNNRVFRSLNRDLVKLTNYVVKYLTKDLYSYKKLLGKAYRHFSLLYPNWQTDYDGRLAFNRFRSKVLPFHRQSLGFGRYLLQKFTVDEIVSDMSVPILTSKGYRRVAIPFYYVRKLFYQVEKFCGKYRWVPNDNLRNTVVQRFSRSVKLLSCKLLQFEPSLKNVEKIAEYSLFWRGMLVKLSDLRVPISKILLQLYSDDKWDTYDLKRKKKLYFGFNTMRDRLGLHGSFISQSPPSPLYGESSIGPVLTYSEFCAKPFDQDLVVCDQNTLPDWNGFDDFLDAFSASLSLLGESKNKDMEFQDKMLDRYKELGFVSC